MQLTISIGAPIAAQNALVALSEMVIVFLASGFGPVAIAAYGAVSQITTYVQFPANSIGIAVSVFAAQATGARRTGWVGILLRASLGWTFLITGGLLLGLYLAGSTIIRIFLNDPDAIALTQNLLVIVLWSYLAFGVAAVLSSTMRGAGSIAWPTIITIAVIWAVELPVAFFLSRRIGVEGIWAGYPVAFVSAVILHGAYFLAVWRKRVHARLI